jgi:hypothetical protein
MEFVCLDVLDADIIGPVAWYSLTISRALNQYYHSSRHAWVPPTPTLYGCLFAMGLSIYQGYELVAEGPRKTLKLAILFYF